MTNILFCKKCDKQVYQDEDVFEMVHEDCGEEVEEVCEFCLGTGEVVVDEQVYPAEGHYAPIGVRKCLCQREEETEE